MAQRLVNGVDVDALGRKAETFKQKPDLAHFRFSAQNKWLDGGHTRTTIKGFYGMKEEFQHERPFVLDADEPPMLVGKDRGANPVCQLLSSLVSCLTTSMVYHAAVRGIKVEEVESSAEGDIDLRGFMGLTEDVRKGYQNITVTFRVKADAPKEKLEELARFSPVYDVVSQGTKVELRFE